MFQFGLNFTADILLASTGLYVAVQMLLGWLKEKQANSKKPGSAEHSKLLEDAKTFYASASLSRPWVFFALLIGTLTKIIATVLGAL